MSTRADPGCTRNATNPLCHEGEPRAPRPSTRRRSMPLPLFGGACALALLACAGAAWAGPDINQHGLSGAWADSATPGQGFVIETIPDFGGPGNGYIFGGWFTYDTTPGAATSNRWYTFQADLHGGTSSADVVIFQSTGGVFGGAALTTTVAVGTGTIVFDTCTSGQFAYAFDDGRSGTVPLHRLMPNVACDADTTPGDIGNDFGLSGTWADTTTTAQGMVVEINPIAQYAFLAWFSYDWDDTTRERVSNQRWFTAQRPYVVGQNVIDFDVYETIGGVFDGALPTTTVPVGRATITFTSCTQAELEYRFTSGSLVDHLGTMHLSRIAVAPSVCAN